MRWPVAARHLYEEVSRTDSEEGEGKEEEEEEKWKRLTPFKVTLSHQKAIVEAQLEVAIELGVNVSFHSVAAPGTSARRHPYDALLVVAPRRKGSVS